MKKYIMAILIWIMIIPIAILNGGFREYVLVPKIKNCVKRDYIILGVIWFILTNLFDLVAYIKDGGGFIDLVQSYNILTGNTWFLVVLSALPASIFCFRSVPESAEISPAKYQ